MSLSSSALAASRFLAGCRRPLGFSRHALRLQVRATKVSTVTDSAQPRAGCFGTSLEPCKHACRSGLCAMLVHGEGLFVCVRACVCCAHRVTSSPPLGSERACLACFRKYTYVTASCVVRVSAVSKLQQLLVQHGQLKQPLLGQSPEALPLRDLIWPHFRLRM